MFVTFEGIEGAGKSTLMRAVGKELAASGRDVLETREPGDNALGRLIRPIILDARNDNIGPSAELFLFLADRAQHLEEVILPALDVGRIVLCDRFADSTIVYQGFGRGHDIARISKLNALACNGVVPDLTILPDLPVEIGLERAQARNNREGTAISEGRFDSESLKFHERVRQGFLKLARENPERFLVIDGLLPQEAATRICLGAILESLDAAKLV